MDEDWSLDILYADEYVLDELYQFVRHGLCSELDSRLHQLSNSVEYLTALRWYNQEQLTVSLLMVAALNGYDDIVRVLLTHCDPIHQIELKGQIIISDEVRIDGGTALYCACCRGHFTVAKTLIELGGASPNADTYDYPNYPLLIYATQMNRLDIVRFLIENEYSDVNETGLDIGINALMWAAFQGHTSLVEYLIDYGADVNYSHQGLLPYSRTPLLFAAAGGHVETIRLLYEAGVDISIKNDLGITPLTVAVERRHYSIISFLLDRFLNTVEDLELAVCSLINVSSSIEQIHETLELLKMALHRRNLINIPKVCIQPIAAYNYKQECQTVDELNDIKDDRDRMFIETLLIRERLFVSREDIAIMKPLHYYGDMLVQKEEFDKCLEIWIHMFYLYQQMKLDTLLHRFVWLFCKMLMANRFIPVDRFLQVCRLIFEPSQLEQSHFVLYTALFLVVIATKILEQEGVTREEQTAIYHWIVDLCRLQLTTKDGRTLLHLCVDLLTNTAISFRRTDILRYVQYVEMFITRNFPKFPNQSALRLLLTCGSRWLDLDAPQFSHKNTPLHLICQGTKDRGIIEILLNSRCHRDCVNKSGKIPIDYVKDEKIRALLCPQSTPLNLKCLCARIVATEGLNTESLGTSRSALHKFVLLHGN